MLWQTVYRLRGYRLSYRFRIHKSDIITGKIRCGVASHFLNVCKSATCKTEYLQVQLVEHAFVREGEDADKELWQREKYW